MLFNSTGEINRVRKEINRLLSKGMSNICLKVSFEKKWHTENFNFIKYKKLVSLTVFGELHSTHADIIEFSIFYSNLKIRDLGAKVYIVFLLF